ncbi:MAG: DUF1080 domain-containing protein [Chitinophagaceae bacterium]
MLIVSAPRAQTLALTDLSSYKPASGNWHIAGDVKADLNGNSLVPSPGTGILLSIPEGTNADLFSVQEHGDADIELDYLMAKGSNSGIYLQGRYEIQLLDSWGVINPKAGDNGGIYERWDESRPEGQKGYEGYAPRQSVSKAPGLWQHLKISFQAPVFTNGVKTENAKILRIELNGVLIHENIELFGITRGGIEGETVSGPLRLQGDHGAVAFRNIMLTKYGKQKPAINNLSYGIYKTSIDKEPDYAKAVAQAKGTSSVLTSNFNGLPDSFILHYAGTLKITEPGEYNFALNTAGGRGIIRINKQELAGSRRMRVTLPAGDLPFELTYLKFADWATPSIGLAVSGPGIREYFITDANNASTEITDPILITAPVNTLLRSFIDIPGSRVTHAVSEGSPEGIHYTYDMDNGAIVQVWRGGFLDATPMWHERGDGSSRATGSVQRFGKPVLSIAKLSSPTTPWTTDTLGTGYRPKGYELDEKDRPIFHYFIYGSSVNDAVQVLENRQGLSREITIQQAANNLYVRLAEDKNIEALGNGLYIIGDKSYYLKIENASGEKEFIRDSNGNKQLLVPVKTKLNYTILF